MLVRPRQGQARRLGMLRGADGRIIKTIRRTPEQCAADFWVRVDIRGINECWEWLGAMHDKRRLRNYGSAWALGKRWFAHRLAFLFSRGSIADELNVCHACDNPPCCNPWHLFAGTAKDNAQDCISKGRFSKECGEDRYCAKLTEEDVRSIRRDYVPRANGGTLALAKRYGVSRTAIWNLLHGVSWKHVQWNDFERAVEHEELLRVQLPSRQHGVDSLLK